MWELNESITLEGNGRTPKYLLIKISKSGQPTIRIRVKPKTLKKSKNTGGSLRIKHAKVKTLVRPFQIHLQNKY